MDFAKVISEEKKRITLAIAELNKQKAELDTQIKELNKEMKAVIAYETAKTGKPARGKSVRSQVLALIKSKPHTRAEIIESLGLEEKGQTVSNTLSSLKKKGTITLKDGVYSYT